MTNKNTVVLCAFRVLQPYRAMVTSKKNTEKIQKDDPKENAHFFLRLAPFYQSQ